MKTPNKTLSAIIGAAFVSSLALAPVVHATQNPFAMQALSSGYMVAEADTKATDMPADGKAMEGKMKDGKCSTGKCSASKKKAMKGEAEMKAKEGNCSAEKKAMSEDKAKEGNCSANKK